VLHDLNLAARYCDYLIVMKDGQIVSSGTPSAVIAPELLRDGFEVEGTVVRDPATSAPVVIPERAWSPSDEPPLSTKMPLDQPNSIKQPAYA
jgi:iron complex transport system ATP-binding protein